MTEVYKKNGTDNAAYVVEPSDGNHYALPQEKKTPPDNKEDDNRAQWGNGLEFLMSCIAMSVGLGNIWRFPFTAKENGGGAFLIPYLIVLTIIGRPLYYMEMALGQFSSRGNVKMYEKLSPVLKGIGFGQLIGSICVGTYYCCLMAITLFYLVSSFTTQLPWTHCQQEWESYLISINRSCVDASSNATAALSNTYISSSELWFRREVLKQIDIIDDGIGIPEWRLTLCLIVSWVVTSFVSIKGVRSSGKASYFLALFPYVIMITLLIRAATLPGADKGMSYFIQTDWNKLKEASVWYAAVTQCFFSLNVGFGAIIVYSSYNPFTHNINRDAFIVTTLDTFTSLLSGATIFGILGNLAYKLGVDPANVISTGGTGLAFISYPEAIAKFDYIPWLFAILFFFMLFVLGVGSLVSLQASCNTVVHDSFPNLQPWIISVGTAIGMLLIGLIYITPGGEYMLDLVDHFGGTFIVFVFAILEVCAVIYLYGLEEFCLDIEFMTKVKVNIYFRICWGIITPLVLVIIFVYFVVTLPVLTYGLYAVPYPDGVLAFGWSILAVSMLQAAFWLFYYIHAFHDYPANKIIQKTFSTETWSPNGSKRIEEWRNFKDDRKRQNMNNSSSSWIVRKIRFIFLGH